MSGGEKLSQEQIDALLKAMQEGTELPDLEQEAGKKEKYQEYDFNRPEKFGTDQLKTLQTIANSFGKTTVQALSARLRLPVEMEMTTVDQVPFMSEYVEIMPKDYYLYCTIDLGVPALGQVVIDLDLAFIIYMHECWLGGDSRRDFALRRPLTTFEYITLDNLFQVLCDNLKQAFASITEIRPKLVSAETTPTALKITTGSDIISLLNVNIKTDYWNTAVRIGIPFLSVEPIMDMLTSENVIEYTSHGRKNYEEEVEQELRKVTNPVHVSIGQRKMTIAELMEIEEGDIIPLQTKVTDKLRGYVGGKHKFNCFIGRERNRKAFSFKEYIE